jgi:tRNA G46 methylase TrmB
VLRKGGTVRIVTDHAEYFQHIRLGLGSADGLANLENAGAEAVGSNFEKKYVADGRRFYAVAALRCR